MLLRATIERKHPSLPRFVVVPAEALAPWALDGTTVVEVALAGVDIGRRALKRWGPERDVWFMDLTAPQCRAAGVDVGDTVELRLRRADEGLPAELQAVLSGSARARAMWDAWPPGRRRQAAEAVRSARRTETRTRRARRLLSGHAETEEGAETTHSRREAL